MGEKRFSGRRPVRYGAKIAVSGRTISCELRDRSSGGARLRVLGGAELPDRFDLMIENQAEWLHAQVVWRRWRDLGVRLSGRRLDGGRPSFGRRGLADS